MSHAYYSLYCKQSELQQPWEAHWACGFACLVTCFRILGDRTTEDRELIERFRAFGGKPHDGMTTDEAIDLAEAFGYRTVRNPNSTRRSKEAFLRWMRKQWTESRPIMVSVDSANEQDKADHWWTVYGDPEQANVWVMEPLQDNLPFQVLSLSDVAEYASCNDGDGFIEYEAVAVLAGPETDGSVVPPSTELTNFLNAQRTYRTGWTSHAVGAALVDNHFSSLEGLDSQGQATGRGGILVSKLLEPNARVQEVIRDWATFFSARQEENMAALKQILYDVEAHMQHCVAKDEAERMVHEIALNLILIATNLMDA